MGILLIITFSYWVRLLEAQPNQLKFHWYDTMGRKIPSYSENMTIAMLLVSLEIT